MFKEIDHLEFLPVNSENRTGCLILSSSYSPEYIFMIGSVSRKNLDAALHGNLEAPGMYDIISSEFSIDKVVIKEEKELFGSSVTPYLHISSKDKQHVIDSFDINSVILIAIQNKAEIFIQYELFFERFGVSLSYEKVPTLQDPILSDIEKVEAQIEEAILDEDFERVKVLKNKIKSQ